MKFRHFLVAAIAAVFSFASCEEEESFGPAAITVTPTELTFTTSAEASNAVSVTASRDWWVSSKPDWVGLSVEKGAASKDAQVITVTVVKNGDYNREGEIIFTIGLAKQVVKVTQVGDEGEYQIPTITCAEFIEKADPATDYRLVGKVVSAVNATYCSFDLNDGTATVSVWTVNNKDEWKDVVKKGGTVSVYGKYTLYENGTSVKHEMVDAYIESFEPEEIKEAEPSGTGAEDDPFNVAAAVDAVKDLSWTSATEYDKVGPYYVEGVISTITESFSKEYGNATFYITDEGCTQEFYAFRVLYFNNKKWTDGDTQIKVGDKVVLCAELMNYRGDTPETVQGSAYVYSINGEKGEVISGGDPAGTGTEEDPYNIAAAIEQASDLTWTSTTEYQKAGPFYIKGIVATITENFDAVGTNGTQYGNATFTLVDEGFNEAFTAYRVLYLGNKKWTAGQEPILAVGDEVVICAEIMNYRNNTPETVTNSGYVYSINGFKGQGQETTGAEPAGTGTLEDPLNIAAAIDKAAPLTWTSNTDYQKVGPYYIKGKVATITENFDAVGTNGTQYGNATFTLVDDGYNDAFTAFRVLYLGNQKWTSGQTPLLAVGDEVIIYAEIMNYRGNTPETVQNSGYVYSINGQTGGGDTPVEEDKAQPEGNGSLDSPFNVSAAIDAVANLTWTSNSDYQKVGPYYVKGKVGAITENFDAVGSNGTQYGNATFTLVDEGYSAKFTAYRILYLGNKKWESGQTPLLAVGDEVIICAELMNYRGNTPETVQNSGYVYSINGQTGGGDTPVEEDKAQPEGNGSLDSPFNVSAAIDAVANLTWTSNTDYQKVGPYYVKGKVSAITDNFDKKNNSGEYYGNATFKMVDTGFDAEFTAYRILYFGGEKWVEGQSTLQVGDEVIIYGELMNYRGDTPETVQNSAYLYSLNGETGGGEVEPTLTIKSFTINADGFKAAWSANFDGATFTGKVLEPTGAPVAQFSSEASSIDATFSSNDIQWTIDAWTPGTQYTLELSASITGTSDSVVATPVSAVAPDPDAQGGEVVIVIADYAAANSWADATKYTTIEKDGVTLTATGGGNTGKYYNNGNNWRFYQNENAKITVSSNSTISSVVFEFTVSNTGKLVAPDGSEVKSGEAVSGGGDFSVGNSGSATNGQVRFTKITVTLQ